jgi:hypothetical protein
MKRFAATVTLLACAMLVSCNDPEAPAPTPPKKDPVFNDLSQKEHVVQNLVGAYLTRDNEEYERVLDPEFRFYFSDGDVSDGLPEEGWSRTQDLASTANLLDPDNPEPNRIVSIDLDVNSENLVWQAVADTLLADTLLATNTTYSFAFRTANDISYITYGAPQVQFFVRNVGTDAAPQWRLVRWHDVGLLERVGAGASALVEETNWGRVKALYSN